MIVVNCIVVYFVVCCFVDDLFVLWFMFVGLRRQFDYLVHFMFCSLCIACCLLRWVLVYCFVCFSLISDYDIPFWLFNSSLRDFLLYDTVTISCNCLLFDIVLNWLKCCDCLICVYFEFNVGLLGYVCFNLEFWIYLSSFRCFCLFVYLLF